MNTEIKMLETIKHAISQLDLRGENKIVSKAMYIVSAAIEKTRRGEAFDSDILFQRMIEYSKQKL